MFALDRIRRRSQVFFLVSKFRAMPRQDNNYVTLTLPDAAVWLIMCILLSYFHSYRVSTKMADRVFTQEWSRQVWSRRGEIQALVRWACINAQVFIPKGEGLLSEQVLTERRVQKSVQVQQNHPVWIWHTRRSRPLQDNLRTICDQIHTTQYNRQQPYQFLPCRRWCVYLNRNLQP